MGLFKSKMGNNDELKKYRLSDRAMGRTNWRSTDCPAGWSQRHIAYLSSGRLEVYDD